MEYHRYHTVRKGCRCCTVVFLTAVIYHHHALVTERVSTRVVVVVVAVRELLSLVTSAICVRIRGHRSEVTRIVYHMAQVFVYCCVLTTLDS